MLESLGETLICTQDCFSGIQRSPVDQWPLYSRVGHEGKEIKVKSVRHTWP